MISIKISSLSLIEFSHINEIKYLLENVPFSKSLSISSNKDLSWGLRDIKQWFFGPPIESLDFSFLKKKLGKSN
jgi:hypothetical protein